jgi:hypothetical protein
MFEFVSGLVCGVVLLLLALKVLEKKKDKEEGWEPKHGEFDRGPSKRGRKF